MINYIIVFAAGMLVGAIVGHKLGWWRLKSKLLTFGDNVPEHVKNSLAREIGDDGDQAA